MNGWLRGDWLPVLLVIAGVITLDAGKAVADRRSPARGYGRMTALTARAFGSTGTSGRGGPTIRPTSVSCSPTTPCTSPRPSVSRGGVASRSCRAGSTAVHAARRRHLRVATMPRSPAEVAVGTGVTMYADETFSNLWVHQAGPRRPVPRVHRMVDDTFRLSRRPAYGSPVCVAAKHPGYSLAGPRDDRVAEHGRSCNAARAAGGSHQLG